MNTLIKNSNGTTTVLKFHSPCECSNFNPVRSGQERSQLKQRLDENTGQIVCGNCGRHEPEKREPAYTCWACKKEFDFREPNCPHCDAENIPF